MKRNLESPKTKIERKAREIDIKKETSEFAEDKIDHLKTYPISRLIAGVKEIHRIVMASGKYRVVGHNIYTADSYGREDTSLVGFSEEDRVIINYEPNQEHLLLMKSGLYKLLSEQGISVTEVATYPREVAEAIRNRAGELNSLAGRLEAQ